MLREMGDALEALAQLEPVALLLEDMHWADPSSSDLLRLLGQRAMARRLLILATLRGSDVELDNHPMKNVLRELSARDQCEELMLPLLDQAAIGRYVDARFQPHDMGPDVAELLAKTTEGHPLFVTRLVQMLVERGDIEHDGKRWRTSRPLAELELRVPNGVRGLIQKKLDSLAEDDRRALQYASVIGVEFDSSALAFVLERDELAVDDQLDALARVHHLLEPLGGERLGDGQLSIRYRFAHVLYQNVLYESLAARRRMLLHQKAAEHLSAALGKDDFRVAAQLALHYEAARDYGRAIQYSRHAADNAARLHANRVAEQHCARALHLIEHLPPSRQIPETVIMRYDHGWCAANAGDGESSIRDFETMLHAARSPEFAGPSPEAARARDAVFDYLEQPWRDAFGLFDMPRMPNQDRSMGAAAIQCEAYWALSFLLIQRGRLDEAAARIGEYLALAQASHNEPRQAEALAFRAWLELERGNFEAALASVESGLPAARAISHARAIFSFLCTGAQVRQLRGDYELAEALSLEALPLNMETVGRVDCLWEVARARAHLGRVSAALAPLAEALDIARRTELVDETQRVLATLGWLHAEIGDLEGAVRHFASAIELAPAAPAARALRLRLALALARCGRGDPTGAASELERRDPIEPSSPAASAGMHPASGRHPQATELESHAADAELQLARGDARAATIAAKALLQAATALGSPKHVELARLVLARAALIRDDVASALEHAHAGTALLVERPMPLIGWRLYDALGAAQRAAGDAAAATAAVTRALDLVDLIERGIEDPALRAIWSSSREVRELRAGAWNHPQGPPSSPRLSSGVGG
jgi:tetratricopeptide (TPR) repeat protein